MLKINEKVSIFRFKTHETSGHLHVKLDNTTTPEEVEAFRKELGLYGESQSVDILIGGDIPQARWQIVDADQLGNLSNAPVLIYSKSGDDVWYDDETGLLQVSVFAALWYYEPYQVYSWVELVLSGKEVAFHRLVSPIIPIPDTIKAAVVKLDKIDALEHRIQQLENYLLEFNDMIVGYHMGSNAQYEAAVRFKWKLEANFKNLNETTT